MPKRDKILHFIAGFIIAFATTFVTGSTVLGNITSISAGGGKELYDRKHPRNTPLSGPILHIRYLEVQ